MAHYTLRFANYAQARGAAQGLGFWDADADCLKTRGDSVDTDGNTYGWAISEIGHIQTAPGVYDRSSFPPTLVSPPIFSAEYYVNVDGHLPPPALAFLAPGGYGCAGVLFAGTEPGPHEIDP
jgi:hypothetical protein